MQPRVAVVDADNRFLRWEDRRRVHADRLDHRSIHVMVFDAQRRLVIQRRHRDKLTFPSHWDLSCSGHVEEPDYIGGPDERLDEVYAACAARELFEELGVRAPLTFLGRFPPIPGMHYEQIALYRAASDGPYVKQDEEVEELRRATLDEVLALAAGNDPENRIVPTLAYFTEWARDHGAWG